MYRTIIFVVMVLTYIFAFEQNSLANVNVKSQKMVAQYITTFNGNGARTHNLKIAKKRINGIVLKPNEEFSYCKALGSRTTENGFKEAGSFSNGQRVKSVGGGICQVSSTLSGAIQKAKITVVERHRHSLPVSYCPPEVEATIAEGAKDFRFKNNTETAIMIKCIIQNNNVIVEIWRL